MPPTRTSQFAVPSLSHVAGEESIFEKECFLKEGCCPPDEFSQEKENREGRGEGEREGRMRREVRNLIKIKIRVW